MVTNSITDNYIKLSTKKRTYMFYIEKTLIEEILNEASDLIILGCFKGTNDYHAVIYTKDEGIIIDDNISKELFKCLKKLATAARRGNLNCNP